jgi:3-oxoadipate enol-lactonase
MSALVAKTGRVSYHNSGDGPPRVLLHSLLTDSNAFSPIEEGLSGRSYAMDLPGFGSTTPCAPDVDEYSTRVADFIDAVGLGEERPVLIGNGLGAFVALGTAIHHGSLLGGLILVGCGVRFPEPARAAFAAMIEVVERGGMEAVVPTALQRIFTADHIASHPGAAAERAAVLRRTDPAAFITACRALTRLDYTAAAPTVTAPTLIVVGEDDAATPPPMAEELHELMAGSELVRLAGVAHAPQIQDPPAFIQAIRPFLEGR